MDRVGSPFHATHNVPTPLGLGLLGLGLGLGLLTGKSPNCSHFLAILVVTPNTLRTSTSVRDRWKGLQVLLLVCVMSQMARLVELLVLRPMQGGLGT